MMYTPESMDRACAWLYARSMWLRGKWLGSLAEPLAALLSEAEARGARKEREACARVAEDYDGDIVEERTGSRIADLIRARVTR